MLFPQDTLKSKSIPIKPNRKQNGHLSCINEHNCEEIFICKENDGKNLKEPDTRVTFAVIGNRVTKEFIYCMYMTLNLHKYKPKQFKVPVIKGVTSVEWPKARNDLKIKFSTLAHSLDTEVAVLINDKFLGGENELKIFLESRYNYHLRLDYYKEGIQQFANFIYSQGRPCAYLHISINGDPIGALIFMLYADIVPLTCQNFLRLCQTTKGGYAGTPIHRIVKDNWIQCGGFNLKSNKDLICENFIIPQDRRGVLCMANNGRHNDCSTQFFVLLQPAPWMDHKYVAFGQLIEGEKTLRTIENTPTYYESPKAEVIIYKAGIFDMSSKIPVNKNTKDYLNEHIEDLNVVGEIFYEDLIEKVFAEMDNKNGKLEIIQDNPSLEDVSKNVHPVKRFVLTSEERDKQLLNHDDTQSLCTPESYETIANYESYSQKCEDDSYYGQVGLLWPQSMEAKPMKKFYIPLTDVPYPGEVHSHFDLQRLLRGEYCLQNDLQKDPVQKQDQFNIPDEVICAIFENYKDPDEEREYYLNPDDDAEIKKYVKKCMDRVSFAGPLVKKIADQNKRRELFNDLKDEKIKIGALTDEELRLIRMAKKINPEVNKYSETNIYSESSLEYSRRVSETKSNSSRLHFDEDINYSNYDGSSSIFRDTKLSSNGSINADVRDQELYQLPSQISFMNLNSSVAEKQFLVNTRKRQPSMTIVEYQMKNLLYETNLKNEKSINVDNVCGGSDCT